MASVEVTFTDQVLFVSVVVNVSTTWPELSTILIVTGWPLSASVVVPAMAKPALAALALTTLLLTMVSIAIVGGVSSTLIAWEASAERPAAFDTSAVSV